MFYFIKTPWWLRALYPGCIWEKTTTEKILYLTFDDGPHPRATPFVLDLLQDYNAKATFFCIGKNVIEQPAIYKRILEQGHAVGNHTHNHVNGWKVSNEAYIQDIQLASKFIDSNLFRPPYGRITKFQMRQLASNNFNLKVIMWDVLSADFDNNISSAKCISNVIDHAHQGSIIIFHDSTKAFDRMKEALPAVLKYFTEKSYRFDSIKE